MDVTAVKIIEGVLIERQISMKSHHNEWSAVSGQCGRVVDVFVYNEGVVRRRSDVVSEPLRTHLRTILD